MNRRTLLLSVAGLPLAAANVAPAPSPIMAFDPGTREFTALSVGCIKPGSVVHIQQAYIFQGGDMVLHWVAANDASNFEPRVLAPEQWLTVDEAKEMFS